MTISKEQAMAFVDGELSPEDERRVAAEIETHPELLSYVERQKNLKANLVAAFAPIMAAPIPERLEQAVASPAPESDWIGDVVAWTKRLWENQSLQTRRSWIPVGAMVAGIVLGVLLGNSLNPPSLQNRNGILVAQAELKRVLDRQLASEQSETATTRVGTSFWNRDGQFCRTFSTPGIAGIACRDDTAWRVAALAVAPSTDKLEYEAASSSLPDSLRTALNAMISGEPLDEDGERGARDQGWRAR